MEKYDVIITGGGLGGLLCGVLLAKEGKTVCILEKNGRIGGCLQTFTRDGVLFDTGFHYLGAAGPGELLYPYLNYAGLTEDVRWHKTDAHHPDILRFAGIDESFPLHQGPNAMQQWLCKRFPAEQTGIETYFRTIASVADSFGLQNFHETTGLSELSKSHEIPASAFINQTLSDPLLRGIVKGLAMLYAADADSSSLYIHSAINHSFLQSSWKCEGGGMELANAMARQIRQAGGKVLVCSEVVRLESVDGKISQAITKDGRTFVADHFIADIHPANLLPLIDNPKLLPPAYQSRLRSMEQTISVFSLYLAMDPGQAFPGAENRYYFDSIDPFACSHYTPEQWPRCFGIFPSSPVGSQSGTNGFSVMTYMYWNEVERWQNTHNTVWNVTNRGADYESFKYQKAIQLLEGVENVFPEFKGKIKRFYASSPLTWRDYTGTFQGAVYGIKRRPPTG